MIRAVGTEEIFRGDNDVHLTGRECEGVFSTGVWVPTRPGHEWIVKIQQFLLLNIEVCSLSSSITL